MTNTFYSPIHRDTDEAYCRLINSLVSKLSLTQDECGGRLSSFNAASKLQKETAVKDRFPFLDAKKTVEVAGFFLSKKRHATDYDTGDYEAARIWAALEAVYPEKGNGSLPLPVDLAGHGLALKIAFWKHVRVTGNKTNHASISVDLLAALTGNSANQILEWARVKLMAKEALEIVDHIEKQNFKQTDELIVPTDVATVCIGDAQISTGTDGNCFLRLFSISLDCHMRTSLLGGDDYQELFSLGSGFYAVSDGTGRICGVLSVKSTATVYRSYGHAVVAVVGLEGSCEFSDVAPVKEHQFL